MFYLICYWQLKSSVMVACVWIIITQQWLNIFKCDPSLLKRAITADETWLNGYDFETKTQSSQVEWNPRGDASWVLASKLYIWWRKYTTFVWNRIMDSALQFCLISLLLTQLGHWDLFLFQKCLRRVKGKLFATIDKIKWKNELMPAQRRAFQKFIVAWRCISKKPTEIP